MTNAPPPPPPPPRPAPTSLSPRFVYAVFGAEDSAAVAQLVRAAFPSDDFYELSSGDWLVVSASAQASKVFEKIVGENASQLTLIVCRVERFYGLHDAAVWDWIEAQKNGVA